jgi:predicted nuclease of predicted toxin-antitoxin system
VRVLLDESVPRQLAPLLSSHSVSTVPREGWAGLDNGELLDQAVQRFDVLVTGDQSLQYQQNLSGRRLGVVVIAAPDNRVHTITALAPDILAALTQIECGEVIQVPQCQPARDRRQPLR